MRLNTLSVKSCAVRRRSLLVVGDLFIDGTALLNLVERAFGSKFDLVSPLDWMPVDYLRAYAERLIAAGPSILPSGRCELLVCPECGDLGCGCISCVVARDGDFIAWSELGWETSDDPTGISLFPMGGFRFAAASLAGTLGLPGVTDSGAAADPGRCL